MNVGLCGLIKRFLETIQSFLRFTENWPQISWKWLIDFASAINRAALRQKTHWCRCDKKMNTDWQTDRTFTKSNILAYISNGIRCGVSGGDKFFAIFQCNNLLNYVGVCVNHSAASIAQHKRTRRKNESSTSNNVNVKLKWNHIMLIWIRVCVLFGTRWACYWKTNK